MCIFVRFFQYGLEWNQLVYITGDIHGDITRFASKAFKKLKKDDTLIICGDFGFIWNNTKKEKRILKKLGKKPFTIAFLDGAHENFDILKNFEVSEWNGGRVQVINGNLIHLMRGQIFEIDGNSIFVFGGGESPDKEMRKEHVTWWKDELPSREEIVEAATNLRKRDFSIDYILTHEPPSRIREFMHIKSKTSEKTNGLNVMLEEICNSCEYKHWFFGSLHYDKKITSLHTSIFKEVIPININR